MAAYLKSIFQQRPIKRGPLPLLILTCWFITAVTAFVPLLMLLFGPFVLDGYVGVFALQHHMNVFAVILVVAVLFLLDVASVWTSVQTIERKELLSPALLEAFQEMAEYAEYEVAQKAVKGAEPAPKQEGEVSCSETPSGGALDADTHTLVGSGGETYTEV